MKELALYMMDLIHNSAAANSRKIEISVKVTNEEDLLVLRVEDDGRGMTPEERENAADPLHMSETAGTPAASLPLFKEAAVSTGGGFALESEPGKGTAVTGVFVNHFPARRPLGNFANIIFRTLLSYEDLIINVMLSSGKGTFFFEGKNFKELMKQRGKVGMAMAYEAEKLMADQLKLVFQDILPEIKESLYETEKSCKMN